jgi:hypothetical protein
MFTSRSRILAAGIVILALALIALPTIVNPVFGQVRDRIRGGPPAPAHYTVVMTEAHNLLVTDNANNKLYFYTIDKDKPIGSPLKLRASVDLAQVGEEEIKLTPHNLEKADK